MYLEEIDRHLSVSSIPELEKSLKRDKGFWNIVSIREPNVRKPEFLCQARSYVEILCEDTERDDPEHSARPPRAEDASTIFEFLDRHPEEPVMVHCFAGLSRSTAVALAIIVKALMQRKANPADLQTLIPSAVDLLVRLRPQARPNLLFLRLYLENFLPADQAERLASALINHPVLLANRSEKPRPRHLEHD